MNGTAGASPFDVLVAKHRITPDEVALAERRIASRGRDAAETAMFLAAIRPEAYEPPAAEDATRAAKPRFER